MRKLIICGLAVVSSTALYAFDYCKAHPDKNNGSCEKQDPTQVECVKIEGYTINCYSHGSDSEPREPSAQQK